MTNPAAQIQNTTMSNVIHGTADNDVMDGSQVEHTGDIGVEDVPREVGDYRPHVHFIDAFKRRTEITGELINTLITEGEVHLANGHNRFLFTYDVEGPNMGSIPFWLVVELVPEESKHLAITAYSPVLHGDGKAKKVE